MTNTEYTLIFGLGPKTDGTPNTDVDVAIAFAAIEDTALKSCGGFTIHRGKGGWIDPTGKLFKGPLRERYWKDHKSRIL